MAAKGLRGNIWQHSGLQDDSGRRSGLQVGKVERGNACLQAQLPTCIAALLAADLAQAVSVQANDRVLRARARDDAGPTFGQSALSCAEPDAATKDKTKEARRKFADNSDCFDLDLCSWVGLPIWNGQKFRGL